MRTGLLLAALITIDCLHLVLQIRGLSIGYNEAKILYGDPCALQALMKLSFSFFGQNDYALRLPMIFLHFVSVLLLYAISAYYTVRTTDRLWIGLIYVLLPGVTSAALVVDNAGLMIAAIFAFAFAYLRYDRVALLLMPPLVWIDPAFAYLFAAVTVYGIYRKEHWFTAAGGISLGVSLYFYGIEVSGVPKGHFLDVLGVYAAIFSPIVFVYIFYVLYRRLISKEWDLLWMIATTAFIISLLLSFRQKIHVQTFAPFLMLALPLAGQTFLKTYRIRLREFRQRYRLLFYTAFILLVANVLAVFFNQWLYRFIADPADHFAYPMHVARELSETLKAQGIECVKADDEKMQLRLTFYGITQCQSHLLEKEYTPNGTKVTISYKNSPVSTLYVTKVNNQ